jgi:hypothetical protein
MGRRKGNRRPPLQPPNLTPWWAVAGIIILAGATLLLVGIAIAL